MAITAVETDEHGMALFGVNEEISRRSGFDPSAPRVLVTQVIVGNLEPASHHGGVATVSNRAMVSGFSVSVVKRREVQASMSYAIDMPAPEAYCPEKLHEFHN
ncbi:MAG: hypothetical protein LBQ00_07535 [Syntrophobacterales bacterium]|jgi:hypothetical protein|nr:hypothetical protein [Syntrophobacterales bacterium]